MRDALRQRVITDAGIYALIGARFYHREAPSVDPKPYCVYMVDRTDYTNTLQGNINVLTATVLIDIVHTDAIVIVEIADLIRARLEAQAQYWDATRIQECRVTAQESGYDADTDEYRETIEVSITWEE